MIVQACLNGARPRGFHQALPLTSEELAADAAACVAAGAAELHVHPRDRDGRESLDATAIGAAIAALRRRLPGTAVGVSTGDWITGDDARRRVAIATWTERPDYASVNLGEADAPAVMALLLEQGIGIEAGLAGPADAERLVACGLGPRCWRMLIEMPDGDAGDALARAVATAAVLDRAGLCRPRLLHGFDATVWPVLRQAAAMRFSTRIGLEDGKALPDGRIAPDNAVLVRAAVAIMRPGAA